jgi:hypothetical protein
VREILKVCLLRPPGVTRVDGDLSYQAIAKSFGVSRPWVIKLARREVLTHLDEAARN